MKKLLFLCLLLTASMFSAYQVKASSYTADDKLIDELFTKANETVNVSFTDITLAGNSTTSVSADEKSAPVALLLDFFLGELGIHRFYLGTETLTGCGYPLTCGGFGGIVPLVDFVVLIINIDDISKYVNNPKFFMW